MAQGVRQTHPGSIPARWTVTTEPTTTIVAVSLASLATTINEEYRLASRAASDALVHAINCGDALLAARDEVPHGSWEAWIEANVDVHIETARRWCRLARNKAILGDLSESIEGALRHLQQRGIPSASTSGNHPGPSFDVLEAKRLKTEGLNYNQIAKRLFVKRSSVVIQLDPEAKKRNQAAVIARKKRQAQSRKAIKEMERDKAIKKVGGDVADLYAAMRRFAIVADRLIVDSDDAEYRTTMRSVVAAIHAAEDGIVRALRIGRTA